MPEDRPEAHARATATLRGDPPMRLFLARVGRDSDTCDRCRETVPPFTICRCATNGMLYCEPCAVILSTPAREVR